MRCGHCVCSEECFCLRSGLFGEVILMRSAFWWLCCLLASDKVKGSFMWRLIKSVYSIQFGCFCNVPKTHTHTHTLYIHFFIPTCVCTRIYTLKTSSYSLPMLSLSLSLSLISAPINTLRSTIGYSVSLTYPLIFLEVHGCLFLHSLLNNQNDQHQEVSVCVC